MQQLHVVGVTTELDSLILSARKGAKSGSFVVPLDDRLLDVIADAVRRRQSDDDDAPILPPELGPAPAPPKRTSLLSPREIQARLRAGRSLAQVSKEAATDEDWVAKFAPPVLAERERVITWVRDLRLTTPRRGESGESLGASVRWNLADRGVRLIDDEFDACWSAFHVDATLWAITFGFVSRGRRQKAEWEVDLADGVLVSRNRLASALGYVEPGRRRRPSLIPEPDEAARRSSTRAGTATKSSKSSKSSKTSKASKASKSSKSPRPSTSKSATPRRTAKATKRSGAAPGRPAKAAAKVGRPPRRVAGAKAAQRGGRSGGQARTTGAVAKPARSAAGSKSSPSKRTGPRPRVDAQAAPPPAQAAPRAPDASFTELDRRKMQLVQEQSGAALRRPGTSARTEKPAAPATPRQAGEPAEARLPRVAAEPGEPEGAREANDAAAAARERREERRRARAARAASGGDDVDTTSSRPAPGRPSPVAIPDDDSRVVTIRAPRASSGEVVVPGGPRPLRPARPAVQPRRRRFTRQR